MSLRDPSNRTIDYLRISVTDRCDLSCVYCKPRAGATMIPHQEILRYEEMLRIVRLAVPMGITHVRITGGEPLVRRGVLGFIAKLREVAGVEDVSLTTNGVLLGEMCRGLRDAGISRLNISLDSLKPRRFREITGSDAWDRVWQGIAVAEAAGFSPIKINMVPVNGVNDDEVADFARLTLERRLHVRFIEFMPIGANDRWHTEACVTSDRVRGIIEHTFGPLAPFLARDSAGPSDNYQIPGARGVIGFISPISKHFCASCRRLRLTADGRLRPCLLSDAEIDIKSPMRCGCSDEELKRLLRFSLEKKPERHHVNEDPAACSRRIMSRIGG